MKQHAKKKFLDAVRKQLTAAGFPQPEEAVKARTNDEVVDQAVILKNEIAIEMWEKVNRLVKNMPEFSTEEIEKGFPSMESVFYELRDRLLQVRREMPHRKGGNPGKLVGERRKRAAQGVGYLMGSGDTYAEAVSKVAHQYGVSAKTIQRAWQEVHRRKDKSK